MGKAGQESVDDKILEYLMDQNRPFNLNDISSNLPKDIGKASVIRALDMLVRKQKIKEKCYGKQKIYFINQDMYADNKNSDLHKMDSDIAELTNTFSDLEQKVNTVQVKLKNTNNTLTTDNAELELTSLNVEIPKLKDKLHFLQSDSKQFDPDEMKKVSDEKEKYLKEYKRRKRIANSIIDAILEGYPKSKKQLLEEIGVELDDDKTI